MKALAEILKSYFLMAPAKGAENIWLNSNGNFLFDVWLKPCFVWTSPPAKAGGNLKEAALFDSLLNTNRRVS